MLRASSGRNVVQEELMNESAPRNTVTKRAGEGADSEVSHDFTDTQLSDIQTKHALLRQEYKLLGTRYRRWKIGVVENARLLIEQEEDLTAERDTSSDLNKTIKQPSSDNAWPGAELVFPRRTDQYNPNLLKQTLRRSSLIPDVMDHLLLIQISISVFNLALQAAMLVLHHAFHRQAPLNNRQVIQPVAILQAYQLINGRGESLEIVQ